MGEVEEVLLGSAGFRYRLRARFFGRFEVSDEAGAKVDLGRSAKAVAVFKCLVVRHPGRVSQDFLMDLLWPESNPKRGRWSLNSAVYTLRKALRKSLSYEGSGEFVVLERGGYRLGRDLLFSSDVEEFEKLYQNGRRFDQAGEPARAILEYERAVGLYRGDYLVEDLYEDWTMIERERLANAYVDMLGRLGDHYADAGDLQEAIEVLYQLLRKDPFHEASYRALMRCYADLGLRSRAIEQYELCERALGRLYGSSPEPETRALAESLRRGG